MTNFARHHTSARSDAQYRQRIFSQALLTMLGKEGNPKLHKALGYMHQDKPTHLPNLTRMKYCTMSLVDWINPKELS